MIIQLSDNESVTIRRGSKSVTVTALGREHLNVGPITGRHDADRKIVRIRPDGGRLLSYYSREPLNIGDLVRVTDGVFEGAYARVEGYGAGSYGGPLKVVERVPV